MRLAPYFLYVVIVISRVHGTNRQSIHDAISKYREKDNSTVLTEHLPGSIRFAFAMFTGRRTGRS